MPSAQELRDGLVRLFRVMPFHLRVALIRFCLGSIHG